MYTVTSLDGDIYNHEYFLLEDVCRLCWKRNATQEISCKSVDNDTEYSIPLLDQIRDCLDIILTHECRPKKSCGRVFTRQDYLHKHKLTHTGTKQHVCPHCGFRSTQRSSLIVHIRKHTGERPYSCDMCPQRCISSSNLRAHRRRHFGLKKFHCTICDKKFGYKVSLEEHIESSHHRSQTHPCPHCGAHYSRKRGLKRHLTAKHCENEPSEEGEKVDSLLEVL
ncbi:zinc finger protein ZFP2-like isoform X2 [Cydia pomonella]|uniref:zinc finger protein ZFP2-like isoform X2 n=1 Tax=Cydia pomonella TaxID=82600 RepID=UPI002ADE7FFB|nr:zinc finger protein ZFP2-like isoform X2 [Cydia pomonella]